MGCGSADSSGLPGVGSALFSGSHGQKGIPQVCVGQPGNLPCAGKPATDSPTQLGCPDLGAGVVLCWAQATLRAPVWTQPPLKPAGPHAPCLRTTVSGKRLVGWDGLFSSCFPGSPVGPLCDPGASLQICLYPGQRKEQLLRGVSQAEPRDPEAPPFPTDAKSLHLWGSGLWEFGLQGSVSGKFSYLEGETPQPL